MSSIFDFEFKLALKGLIGRKGLIVMHAMFHVYKHRINQSIAKTTSRTICQFLWPNRYLMVKRRKNILYQIKKYTIGMYEYILGCAIKSI